MNQARCAAGVTELDGKVYAAGEVAINIDRSPEFGLLSTVVSQGVQFYFVGQEKLAKFY